MEKIVNTALVCQRLRSFATRKKLINWDVTSYSFLELLTINLIQEAVESDQHYMEVVDDLIQLWFPSLWAGLIESGGSWSHYFDLDLVIEHFLKKAGYPIEDAQISNEI